MVDIKHIYAPNRTEEVGMDLHDQFVIPPYFDNLEFGVQKKPLIFEGGRGSGKTTLLRYLSYRTQFSPYKTLIKKENITNIGIYYKADISHVTLFSGQGIIQDKWIKYFEHFLCLLIASEVLDATNLLLKDESRINGFANSNMDITFPDIVGFDNDLPKDIEALRNTIRRKRFSFSTWLNNFDSTVQVETPLIYPLKDFILYIISCIKEKNDFLHESVFHIFIDEYENLSSRQQRLINTYIKESEIPLSFHIAMKKNGMLTKQTLGNEAIQEKEDFRTISLEDRLEKNFDLFASELFFFRLINVGYPIESTPINPSSLKDEKAIKNRFNNQEYRDNVIKAMDKIFPSLNKKECSDYVLKDKVLKSRLIEIIKSGLKENSENINTEEFIDLNFPEASIVSASVLNQVSKNPSLVLKELNDYKKSNIGQYKEWIHKYLQGTLLLLWLPLSRPCLLYSGRKTYITLSKLNIRHFLEMCHAAVNKIDDFDVNNELIIDQEKQALAAWETSNHFYEKINSSGIKGNRLSSLVETIGRIFKLSQERFSQSEFEITHFAIASGNLSEEAQEIISEAIKWSVLSKESETKVKADRIESFEYILNPIYAPYFGISYNKGRKIELYDQQAEKLFTGDRSDLESLVKAFILKWKKEENESSQISIFGKEE